ncbi:hypothetical protein TSUD_376250 [Trifolium subterraneum]|uniref:Uncharacterized protein n=1 Tax=Trifolium subterraneum TaxID=3900 RepID=A0A2Z6M274_TRISU|nr:hypothetical protein TSUD_376250 [Trifolium subterraneum]
MEALPGFPHLRSWGRGSSCIDYHEVFYSSWDIHRFFLDSFFHESGKHSVSIGPAERFRDGCSFRSLRISSLHRKFPLPLPYSSLVVSTTCPGLSPGIAPTSDRWGRTLSNRAKQINVHFLFSAVLLYEVNKLSGSAVSTSDSRTKKQSGRA